MRVAEPGCLAELIADCAELPTTLLADHDGSAGAATPWVPASWLVDDSCAARVAGLDDYGS
ncbi:hypothetical protein [Streptoalloteichus hindustanus]|uniref:Uncharacterized protein n=1 Tax=Streptoalloteichus hindustanus TaxID=2017 RepID=A0A1M5BSG0_STRHI|nr:hypothetical protein [Streptoalloteichus hindustanus]SHF45473.1 hypothetical protein SAMN05444320_103713 [Streptoalloteichus hindustanus]